MIHYFSLCFRNARHVLPPHLRRPSRSAPLTAAENAYVIGVWNKAIRDGNAIGRGQRSPPTSGVSQRTIASDLCCDQTTVSDILSRQHRVNEERRGRPRKLSLAHERILKQIISDNTTANPATISVIFCEETNIAINDRQVRRLALPWQRTKTHPKPPINLFHRESRLLLSIFLLSNPYDIVDRLCFGDECCIYLDDRNGALVWATKSNLSAIFTQTRVSSPPKVLVWGAISFRYGATNLFILEDSDFKTVNAFSYRRILERTYLPWHKRIQEEGGCPVLGQDNASPHVALSTLGWLESRHVPYFPHWAARSPDLVPGTEAAWGVVKNIIRSKGEIRQIPLLKALLHEAWNQATTPRMLELYRRSFFHNIASCIADGGGNKYPEPGLRRIYEV